MTKVKVNLGGNAVEAEKMEISHVTDPWTTVRLADGTVLKMKLVLQDVFKLPTVDNLTGLPNFLVRSSTVVSVEPPTQTSDVH